MPRPWDYLELRTGYRRREGSPVWISHDAILRAPNHQRWDGNAPEPVSQFGVVHVWLPTEQGQRLVVFRDEDEILVRKCTVVGPVTNRICEEQVAQFRVIH